ncbi:MAG: hypothetical protein AAGF92_01420 [Myxococcota bacterium]
MIDLRAHERPLQSFLATALDQFTRKEPELTFGQVSLYCCPWAGWVSLCINETPQPAQNCPDFDYVEVALYDAPEWSDEYQNEPLIRIIASDGECLELDLEAFGDEVMNAVFFDFLRGLLSQPATLRTLREAAGGELRVGVQLLDSEFNEAWTISRP